MNIAGIDYESVKDGEGVRTTIYVSGCSHNCYNCHNPQTHNINYGVAFTDELQNEIIENIKKRPFISGITWSGGDPFHENNLDNVLKFNNKFRLLMPTKDIWLYTGYTWEQIMSQQSEIKHAKQMLEKYSKHYEHKLFYKENETFEYKPDAYSLRKEIILQCDILVDGRFEEDKKDLSLQYRGSSNQRLIDVKKSLEKGEVVLWDTN